MSEKIQGDNEAWQRWLGRYPDYAAQHNNAKFYDKFQKLLKAIHAKAEADIKLLRWLLTDIDSFRSNASAHFVTMGTEVSYLLHASNLNLRVELQEFLLDEYRREFASYMTPITIQEQLVRRYEWRTVESVMIEEVQSSGYINYLGERSNE